MTEQYYGIKPKLITTFDLSYLNDMHFFLYMPIIMPKHPLNPNELYSENFLDAIKQRLPGSLRPMASMIATAIATETVDYDKPYPYWYVTSKKLHVTPDNMANRPGWHSDGYGTSDVNYIWTDKKPTEFAIQEFNNLSRSHSISLDQFQEQIDNSNIVRYNENDLLRIDERHIHRTPVDTYEGMRHFVKISGSHHKFNLIGNAHNHELDYDWKMYSREELRNMESVEDNSDFVLEVG